ncbi:hypothetical protein BC936DRAFT_149532 [Jimgerdemannia flammicorona]|uniref:Mitochondrial cytochrome c oxidase assembly factor n=1 Tax=Jimgerdemannia flammicorona TaxID=994334 RepID=A0A433DN66_9FUNG|nr:hypothetical protein BC936DRAFT_149532 [Jimgerdemannia flammicorona]
MGGPKLEVFKFGVYIFFPVGVMLYFGGPDFYNKFVSHINFWPPVEQTHRPPTTREDIQRELERLRIEREERWRKAKEGKAAAKDR